MFGYNQQIIRVNGENGARAYQMMPNSSVLLLDENQPLVWVAQTDGAGYKTITPYKIEKYVPEPPVDLNDIMNRLNLLEEKINESNFRKPDKPEKLKSNAKFNGGNYVQEPDEQ